MRVFSSSTALSNAVYSSLAFNVASDFFVVAVPTDVVKVLISFVKVSTAVLASSLVLTSSATAIGLSNVTVLGSTGATTT